MKTIWKKFISNWSGRDEALHAPAGVTARFLLKYGSVLIGTLSVSDGRWTFRYSDEFRAANLTPITEFPDEDKTYESNDLWAFFETRIPSTKQAQVRDIIAREHIAETDEIQLLKRFGRKTIANPFELVAE